MELGWMLEVAGKTIKTVFIIIPYAQKVKQRHGEQRKTLFKLLDINAIASKRKNTLDMIILIIWIWIICLIGKLHIAGVKNSELEERTI